MIDELDATTASLREVEEEYRLRVLTSYRILDSPVEADFEGITQAASLACAAPIAAVSFADRNRIWFKSVVGFNAREISRGGSLCDLVTTEKGPLCVPDTQADARTRARVAGPEQSEIRAYFGIPLVTAEGVTLGSLCVCDVVARDLSDAQRRVLDILASQVMRLLELRRSNSELEAASSRLKSLIDNIGGAVMAEDAQRQVLFANESFRRLLDFDFPENQIVGMHSLGLQMAMSERFPNSESFLAKTQYMISQRRPVLHEVLESKGGRVFERDYLPIFSEKNYEGHIWVYRDVSERVGTEKTLERQRLQMVTAAKMSALGVMASGIAHEINNPLTIIRGNVQVLLKSAEAGQLDLAQMRTAAERIHKTTGRIAKIVASLRTISRDGDNDAFITAQLKTIVEDTLELCQTRFKHNGIELRLTGFDAGMSLECRPVQISQVLLNLLSNAFDAVKDLQERWVSLGVEESDTHYVMRVTDSGHGIPREVRDKLMQPFFTTKPVGQGTGLGLSLARTMMESHHGTLSLDAANPHTCFVIRLPKRQTKPLSR